MSGSFFDFHQQLHARRPRPAAATPAPAEAVGGPPAISVSELTARVDRAIKSGLPDPLFVRGEVSNFKRNAASGHLYFTMKDARSCIDCVIWKSDAVRLRFTPTDGMEVVATGRVAVYQERGKYQLYVSTLRPVGQGALELAFQQLRAKLEREGLFAAERRRPMPAYPRSVVLVTSQQGAALQDMLKVLRRFPWVRLSIYPVPVQGDGAGARIAAALQHLAARMNPRDADVILLGRGGGSLEDLWAFNEEVVARAIVASPIPVITGIGHEVDVSIADLVADYHAHTPTEAAQVITSRWRTAGELVSATTARLNRATRTLLQDRQHRLFAVERHEWFRRPLHTINLRRQFLDDRQRALSTAMGERVRGADHTLHAAALRLERNLVVSRRRLTDQLNDLGRELIAGMNRQLSRSGELLAKLGSRLTESHPRHGVRLRAERLAALSQRLQHAVAGSLLLRTRGLTSLESQLRVLDPQGVLKRGYSITTLRRDGTVVWSPAQVKPGDRLVTRVAEGEIRSVAEDTSQLRLFES